MERATTKRKRDFCNLNLCESMDFVGAYDMPSLKPYDGDVNVKYIPFNRALSSVDYGCGVHFFIDDYQFERIWRLPERYLPVLKRFSCVIAPDFSLFVDVPRSVNIWNVYRNRTIARWLQDNGVPVIPSVSWGSLDTLEFCFDGIPERSVVAIGHTAYGRSEPQRESFLMGVRNLVEQKNPSLLLVYGKAFDAELPNVVFIEDHISKLKRYGKRKPTQLPEALL